MLLADQELLRAIAYQGFEGSAIAYQDFEGFHDINGSPDARNNLEDKALKDYDDYLLQIIAYGYDVSPQQNGKYYL